MLLRAVFDTVAWASLGTLGTKDHRTAARHRRRPLLNRVSDQKWKLHLKNNAGSHSRKAQQLENPVARIINLFVDDLFGTGGDYMEQRVLTRLRKDFQVGPEDCNDVTFTGQRIRDTRFPKRAVQ